MITNQTDAAPAAAPSAGLAQARHAIQTALANSGRPPAQIVSQQPEQPAWKIEPLISMNGYQLREALELAWPDRAFGDFQQGETELVFYWRPAPSVFMGQTFPSGLYIYYDDCPEEGSVHLPETAEAPSAPGRAPAPGPLDADVKQLMIFYRANTLIELARIQAKHIARLQAQLPITTADQVGQAAELAAINRNVAMLAARLVADHSITIRTMFCDGAPTGRMLIDCLAGVAQE